LVKSSPQKEPRVSPNWDCCTAAWYKEVPHVVTAQGRRRATRLQLGVGQLWLRPVPARSTAKQPVGMTTMILRKRVLPDGILWAIWHGDASTQAFPRRDAA
jgi:hypothetical protein